MSKRIIARKALRQDLIKRQAIPDIEDVASSQYFSPLQTRQQRKSKLGLKEKVLIHETELKEKYKKLELPVNDIENKSAIKWEATNWQQVLDNIRQMRSAVEAPVDTMGCHKCADDDVDEKTQRYQKLVALMLSSQTKDETTFAAMKRLKAYGLTPQSMVSINLPQLEELLRPVSFYKNKAKHVQQAARILIDKYESDIPDNIKGLMALPGVGPKMSHICMATAWNKTTGIGVDVHVHRIANRLKWVPKETKEPEQTRQALEAWIPQELWQEVNHLLVGFGQTVCTPINPHCSTCLNQNICPSANKAMKSKKDLIKTKK